MIQKINEVISGQKNGVINTIDVFVIDYKKINGGDVQITDTHPQHDCVHLANNRYVEIQYVSFEDNALKVNTPEGQVKQCECVLFPTSLNDTDWILCIETKYTASLEIALAEKVDYPNTMIKQIISTVNYFREHDIIPETKRVHAILSFPKLLEDFSEAFFTRSEMTAEEILLTHKILIRATNKGVIRSEKTIKL